MRNEKKFLMATMVFPPKGGGGVERMAKFARYSKDFGWRPDVVCPEYQSASWIDTSRLEEFSNIRINRVPNKSKSNIFSRILRRLYPIDANFVWSLKAYWKASKTELNENQVVLTSGPTHSVHLIGVLVKKKMGIKWVADFRDHFTMGPHYKPVSILHRWFDRYFEKLIYSRADKVIVNTRTNMQDIIENFSIEPRDKVVPIYNGFDKRDLRLDDGVKENDCAQKVQYLYLGGMRGDHIDGYFYKVLAKSLEKKPQLRSEIKIRIVGDFSRMGEMFSDLGLEEMFEFQKPVPYAETANLIYNSNACLTWQAPSAAYKGTIAGKVFDYMGMKRPIFSLGQNDGEIASILKENKIGISANPENVEVAAKKFMEFHDMVKSKKFSSDRFDEKMLLRFDRKFQTQELCSIFDDLTDA